MRRASTRVSAGIDQTVMKGSRVSATYSYLRGSRLARGLNVNAPIDGVRPDPRFANVIDVVSDAASRQHELRFDANLNPGAMLPVPKSAPRVSWKRITVFANYTLSSLRNNTDGPFTVAPTGDLEAEWGPAAGGAGGGSATFVPGVIAFGGAAATVDVRQRMNLSLNQQVIRNVVHVAQRQREQRAAVHDADGRRTITPTASSTIVRPASAATRCVRAGRRCQRHGGIQLRVRAFVGAAAARHWHLRIGGGRAGADGRSGAGALPSAVVHPGAEPDEREQLSGLQRHAHVAVLRQADGRERRCGRLLLG